MGGHVFTIRAGHRIVITSLVFQVSPQMPLPRRHPRTIAAGGNCSRRVQRDQAGDRRPHLKSFGLVFTTARGKRLDGNGVTQHFRQALGRTEIAPIRFPDLQHNAASPFPAQE
jgi:hypothetical protein